MEQYSGLGEPVASGVHRPPATTGERRTRRAERILIIGGGIAGLSLAVAIRRWDLRPDIVERAEAWPTSGAGLYLIGAATRALGQLGLAAQVLDEGAVIRVQRFCDHRGNRLAEVDADRYWRGCGPCLGISRTALHQALADRIAGLPIRFGTSVRAIRQEESDVSVEFTDGSTQSYDLVVGADGVRSTVRRLAVGDSEPRFRGQIGWRFITRPTAATPPDGWTVYLGAGSAFLLVPIGRDAVYCYADRVASAREAEGSSRTVSRLRERFRRFALPGQDMLAQLGPGDQPHQSPIEEAAHERHLVLEPVLLLEGDIRRDRVEQRRQAERDAALDLDDEGLDGLAHPASIQSLISPSFTPID